MHSITCRNRHCPKCQDSAAKRWLEARQADLLPVPYYHVVFTLPAPISAIAYTNKAVIYGLLFYVAADPKQSGRTDRCDAGTAHLGIGADTPSPCARYRPRWRLVARGDAVGGLQAGFLLIGADAFARLFRRRFLEELEEAHHAGRLRFFGEFARLADPVAFAEWLAP